MLVESCQTTAASSAACATRNDAANTQHVKTASADRMQELVSALAAALPAAASSRGVAGQVTVQSARFAPELYPFREVRF